MTLKYDIDIAYIAPPEVFADPTSAKMLKQAGIELNARGNYVAKFRDPNTAAALAGAAAPVKAYFEASGFAFVPSGVVLPDHTYDAKFDSLLNDVLQRLTDNIPTLNQLDELSDSDPWNGLRLSDMLEWTITCQPVQTATAEQLTPHPEALVPAEALAFSRNLEKRAANKRSMMHAGFLAALAFLYFVLTYGMN